VVVGAEVVADEEVDPPVAVWANHTPPTPWPVA
jgi:hypothetical protein